MHNNKNDAATYNYAKENFIHRWALTSVELQTGQ